MVLYLAREYKSAGVVSRIATTRKKVEGIKRCSLLFDRERRRFLFAKRAFSRFDVLAFFVLLRLFSLSFLRYFSSVRSSNPSRVVWSRQRTKKKRAAAKQRKRERVCWEGGKNSLSSFFSSFHYLSNKEKKNTKKSETFESGGREAQKKNRKRKSPPKPNKQQKEERKREKKKGERLSRFRFHSHHIHHREALSLWRLESRLRSLASDTTLERASSSRNAFRVEREREFARFSRRENVRFFFLGNFKRLRETAFEI